MEYDRAWSENGKEYLISSQGHNISVGRAGEEVQGARGAQDRLDGLADNHVIQLWCRSPNRLVFISTSFLPYTTINKDIFFSWIGIYNSV